MRPRPAAPTETEPVLTEIADELSEAHLDTIELAAGAGLGPEWERHLDYLRALQRRTSALLARAAA